MLRSLVSLPGIAVAWIATAPLAAAASLIVPVSQTRSVSQVVQYDNGLRTGVPASSTQSADDFAPFNKTASAISFDPLNSGSYVQGQVGQVSSIGDHTLVSESSGYMIRSFTGVGTGSQQSVFDVTFDLTDEANYRVANGAGLDSSYLGTQVVTLWDANGNLISKPTAQVYPAGYPDDLSMGGVGGVLQPGRYRLRAEWNRTAVADQFEWPPGFHVAAYLTFTPIPEPGTSLLVALGLGGLAARRQRA